MYCQSTLLFTVSQRLTTLCRVRSERKRERERPLTFATFGLFFFLLGSRGHGNQNDRCSKAMRDATEAIRLLTEWPPQNHPHFVAQVMAKELNRNSEIVGLWFWFVLFLSCLCFVALGRGVGMSLEKNSMYMLYVVQDFPDDITFTGLSDTGKQTNSFLDQNSPQKAPITEQISSPNESNQQRRASSTSHHRGHSFRSPFCTIRQPNCKGFKKLQYWVKSGIKTEGRIFHTTTKKSPRDLSRNALSLVQIGVHFDNDQ